MQYTQAVGADGKQSYTASADGVTPPTVPNVGTNLPAPAATPAAAFSSVAGMADLSTSQDKAAKLSVLPQGPSAVFDAQGNITGYNSSDATGKVTYQPNPVAKETPTPTPTTTTMVNAKTGQEYTLNDATAEQIQNFKNSGWDIAEGTGTGAGIVPDSTDPNLKAAKDATDQAKADRDAAVAKLTSFNVGDDPALTSLLTSITNQWDQRISDMEKVNDSRDANITTLGIRLGDRYTGGAGGMFGSIITEEERQGVSRISDLESQKQQALASAKSAYENQQWDRYAKLVDIADKTYTEQSTELQKLQETAAAENKKIQDQQIQATRDEAVAGLVKQGVTDATDILDLLNHDANGKQTGDFTLDEIDKALKIANPSTDLTGLSADYKTFKYMKDNKDPLVDGLTYFDYQRMLSNAQRKPTTGAGSFEFSQTQQSQLLSGGFTQSDISAMQDDVAIHGIDQVMAGIPKDKQDLVRRALAGSDTVADITNPGSQFLTTDYISNLIGDAALKKAAGDAGYRHILTSWDTEKKNYLDHLMEQVTQYRTAGYSDKDIMAALMP